MNNFSSSIDKVYLKKQQVSGPCTFGGEVVYAITNADAAECQPTDKLKDYLKSQITLVKLGLDINFLISDVLLFINTVEPQLSEPKGRHTIGLDNRGVWSDEGNRNSQSMGYQVGDN